ncbi:hypothetical protein QVD17_18312 [Tagetes erecta]|uniref:Reverse transcriptase zinc-binding domain-containing protein n=1 Tax=Tagetes erecta TaxID=13708 RepID=A0AAD8NW60_TARER|nr:hypothetical protein QVD17_18312 [Tagetes erecta]
MFYSIQSFHDDCFHFNHLDYYSYHLNNLLCNILFNSILDTLEAKRRKFLWNNPDSGNGICWVSWDRVTTSIEAGGLGLTPLRDANVALLTKWWWRFKHEPNALWRRVIYAIHDTPRTWPILPHAKALAGTWNSIAKLENGISSTGISYSNLIKGVMGNGRQIRFWLDWWVDQKPLKDLFPNLYAIVKDKGCTIENSLIMWCAEQERIQTRVGLSIRHVQIDSTNCAICDVLPESANHLFCDYELISVIWALISTWIKVPPIYANFLLKVEEGHSRFVVMVWFCIKIYVKPFGVFDLYVDDDDLLSETYTSMKVVDLRSAVVMSPTLAAAVVGKPPSSICCFVGFLEKGGDDGVSMSPWRGIHCSHVVMLFDTL